MEENQTKTILVTKSSLPEFEEYCKEIECMWENHWLTNMGEKHEKFREALKQYMGVERIELLTNGHMAIELALQAFSFPEGSEVITSPYTFASTTHAIVRNNLVPVFCDIDENDYTIDVEKIENLITEKTVAILPVHVYGNICNIAKIEEIAKRYNLRVIYDAAHTFGEEFEGVSVGNFGDASCFSFHATKVFHSIEGGAVVFSDDEFGKKLYRLKNFGIRDAETVDGIGANAKMNEFCAAMGICNLRHIDEEISKRKIIFERYMDRLSGISGIRLNSIKSGLKSNYAYFPIIIEPAIFGESRDDIQRRLGENGIGARKYFYPITNAFDCYKGIFDANDTPIALDISKKVLTLPLYASLSLDDVDRICDIILKK